MKTISIRLEDEEKEKLAQFAEEQDLTISQVVRRAIKQFMEMNEIVDKLNQIPN